MSHSLLSFSNNGSCRVRCFTFISMSPYPPNSGSSLLSICSYSPVGAKMPYPLKDLNGWKLNTKSRSSRRNASTWSPSFSQSLTIGVRSNFSFGLRRESWLRRKLRGIDISNHFDLRGPIADERIYRTSRFLDVENRSIRGGRIHFP